jgi:hypothetical protein
MNNIPLFYNIQSFNDWYMFFNVNRPYKPRQYKYNIKEDTFYHLDGRIAIWEFTNAERIQLMKYYLSIEKATMKQEMIDSINTYQLTNNVKF